MMKNNDTVRIANPVPQPQRQLPPVASDELRSPAGGVAAARARMRRSAKRWYAAESRRIGRPWTIGG